MQKLHAPSELPTVLALVILSEVSPADKFCKERDIRWQEHRVMQEYLVALIAKERRLPFVSPRTSLEQPFGCTGSIAGAPKEALRDEMMLGRMAAALDRRTGVDVSAAMKTTPADRAMLIHAG